MTAMFDGKVKQLRLVKLNRGGESYPPLALLDSEGAREGEGERERDFFLRPNKICSFSSGLDVLERNCMKLQKCHLLSFQILWFPVGFSLAQPSANG